MKSPVSPVSPARVLYNCRMQTDSIGTFNQATFRALTNDVSLMQASFSDHAFERHSHDCYAIGTTTHGVQRFRCKGRQYDSQAGDFVLFNPDEDHDGRRGTPDGFRYSIWYVPTDFIASSVAAESGLARSRYFARPHVADPQMAGKFRRLSDNLTETGCESLRAESLVRAFLDTMLRRHGETPQLAAAKSRDVSGAVLANIKDYIRTHYADDITVSDLAVVAGVSRAHLTQAFTTAFHTPPHVFLNAVRIAQAQRRIRRGMPLAMVALECGFADQSHLTRRFKGSVGVTPSAWRTMHEKV